MPSVSRRTFVHRTTAALAAMTLLPGARAEPAGITLGFSLYGMKALPLDEALAACARIGYRNVELALNAGYPTEPSALSAAQRAALRARLAEERLQVSALMLNLSLAADDATHARHLDSLRAAGQLAHDLGIEKPLVETVLGGKPAEWDAIKERMAARLREWAGAAAESGITIALKAHIGSAVNSPERLLWLLAQAASPALCAAYDHSHFALQGMPLEQSLRALLPQTRFIHVKDFAGDAQAFRFLPPGDGGTDYTAYFRLLRELGYRGPVVVEISAQVFNQPGYEPIAAAEKCFTALTAAIKGADSQGF